MRSIKIDFETSVDVDWANAVEGKSGLVQKAAVGVMTQLGSDLTLPARGNTVSADLLGTSTFNFLKIQHTLNFGSLKVRRDLILFSDPRVPETGVASNVDLNLVDVVDGQATIAIEVSNTLGERTSTTSKLTS